ncbi:MAG: NO-inducible flavohemoprotein [Flectobacillus sp.]|uniref:NO-inducible flavohemoprotein n=1 Tax=Flectobacillus sp. TaxID=50419 RepID=UPI003B9D0E73
MASAKTIEIVKATVPVLANHGEAITKTFYQLLFERNPSLKNVFNMTHQVHGDQPRALANAVYAYAANIDNPAVLAKAVSQITQKHSSLSVTPEMYDIVGANLLEAIRLVLGQAASDEIINAWAEAYQELANLFINIEENIYQNAEQKEGGYRGQKEFIITKIEKESTIISSFYLKPLDGSPVPSFKSGQYVAVNISIPDSEHTYTRNYSLSGCPTQKTWRISVKRETGKPKGLVSNYFHEHLKEGDIIKLGIPSGDFTLEPTQKPIVLIAGGVGITPLMSMYMDLFHHAQNEVLFIQCAKNLSSHAFVERSRQLAEKKEKFSVISIYDEPASTDQPDFQGFLSPEILQTNISSLDSEYYFCGPVPFMKQVKDMLLSLGVPEAQMHYEFFGPSGDL